MDFKVREWEKSSIRFSRLIGDKGIGWGVKQLTVWEWQRFWGMVAARGTGWGETVVLPNKVNTPMEVRVVGI